MIKIVYCINRLSHLSVEQFQDYWWNTHGPIAARIKGVRRYVQCHTLPATYANGEQPAYDGAAILWWDNLDAVRTDMGSPELAAALADERNFIDHGRVASALAEEVVEINDLGDPTSAVKLHVGVTRQPGASREQFNEYWTNTHAPLVNKIPGLVKYVRAVSVAAANPANEPDFDGVAECWFRDLDGLREALSTPEAAVSGADIAEFTDKSKEFRFITRERVVVDQR